MFFFMLAKYNLKIHSSNYNSLTYTSTNCLQITNTNTQLMMDLYVVNIDSISIYRIEYTLYIKDSTSIFYLYTFK